MRVIKEAHLVERKRRRTSRKKMSDEAMTRKQRAKTMIIDVKRGGMRREEIERMLEAIFGSKAKKEIKRRRQTKRSPRELRSWRRERSSWKNGIKREVKRSTGRGKTED